jgi:hypothetical protein
MIGGQSQRRLQFYATLGYAGNALVPPTEEQQKMVYSAARTQ